MQVIPRQRCVIVGFDGSPNSVAALRRASEEAQRRHARLDVVRVVPREDHAARRMLRSAKAWLRLRNEVAELLPHSRHITTRLRIAHGEPGTELSRLARQAELLVVGARRNCEHGNPLGGDTVPVVLSAAPCEVTVCEGDPHAAV